MWIKALALMVVFCTAWLYLLVALPAGMLLTRFLDLARS
jgi:hypothetical protein